MNKMRSVNVAKRDTSYTLSLLKFAFEITVFIKIQQELLNSENIPFKTSTIFFQSLLD